MVGLQIQPDVENGDPPIDLVSETDGDGGGRWTGSDDDGRRHQLLPGTPQVDMTRSFPQGPGKRGCTQAFWLGSLEICVLTTPPDGRDDNRECSPVGRPGGWRGWQPGDNLRPERAAYLHHARAGRGDDRVLQHGRRRR